MPFSRFVDFLENGLFIPNATLFEDRWEGLVALKNSLKKGDIDSVYYSNIKKGLEWIHVSCWYNNPNENYLMWKAYGNSNESIRIETTQEKLLQAYRDSSHFFAAFFNEVAYWKTTCEQSTVNVPSFIAPVGKEVPPVGQNGVIYTSIMAHLFVKYDPYHGEDEVRLVCLNKNYQTLEAQPESGIRLKLLNLNDFLEGITLAPGATNEVYETAQIVAEQYAPEISAKIKRSILDT